MPEVNEHGQPVGDVVPGWTPRPWPTPVRLEGRYVALEPLGPAHAPALHDALCGPDDGPLWTYRPTAPPADVGAMEELIASVTDQIKKAGATVLDSGAVKPANGGPAAAA